MKYEVLSFFFFFLHSRINIKESLLVILILVCLISCGIYT